MGYKKAAIKTKKDPPTLLRPSTELRCDHREERVVPDDAPDMIILRHLVVNVRNNTSHNRWNETSRKTNAFKEQKSAVFILIKNIST